jgi:hypothetical protein
MLMHSTSQNRELKATRVAVVNCSALPARAKWWVSSRRSDTAVGHDAKERDAGRSSAIRVAKHHKYETDAGG